MLLPLSPEPIDLSKNLIGNVGLTALADAIEDGAFDSLEELRLAEFRIGYKGICGLTKVWNERNTLHLPSQLCAVSPVHLSGLRADAVPLPTPK